MTAVLNNANIVTFIVSDPLSVGFSAIRTAHPGSDDELVAAANNASGPGAGTVAGDPISYSDFFALINADEWAAMTTAQLAQLASFGDQIKMGDAGAQAKVNALFSGFATSKASLSALFSRPATPWEVHFGKGLSASTSQLDEARNSGSESNF